MPSAFSFTRGRRSFWAFEHGSHDGEAWDGALWRLYLNQHHCIHTLGSNEARCIIYNMTVRDKRIATKSWLAKNVSISKPPDSHSKDVSFSDIYSTHQAYTHALNNGIKCCTCHTLWLLTKNASYINAVKSDFWLPFQSLVRYQASILQLRLLHDCNNDTVMHPYIAVPATLSLVYRAYSRNSLTPLGIVVAALTAVVHAIHPWSLPFALLVVFFLAGTTVTKASTALFQ